MYDLEATRRLVNSKGVRFTFNLFLSGRLPDNVLEELEEAKVLRNGIPNISLLMSLAKRFSI